MKYPDREQCVEYYRELGTPDNIIAHAITVNKVAVFLAVKLKEKGIKINLKLVDAASLLHDLDKWLCLNDKSIEHGFETEKILRKKGFPEVGYYARQHRSDLITEGLKTWEEKIIAYADRRVIHDKIGTIKERFDYLNVRYPTKNPEKRKMHLRLTYDLEREIFSKLDIEPEDIIKL
jgi:putative nucleotidyltransferase with HDIG domain